MRTKRILLVDDKDTLLRLLEATFQNAGYETVSAKDGKEAINILLQQKIDLIVTDILMPNVDGYYLCFKVRTNKDLKDIPIIIYSGTYTASSEEKTVMEMGGDLFIQKPASSKVLVKAANELITNPPSQANRIYTSLASVEAMHLYSSSLINKLESQNLELIYAQEKLEFLVAKRTNDLREANNDLQTINEELRATNEELHSVNEHLTDANLTIEKRTIELMEALSKEKELVEMKNKFVSMASHEFRTPLSVILLNASFIGKYAIKMDQAKIDEKVESIKTQVQYMADLLDNVLKIGKSENVGLTPQLEKVPIGFIKNLTEELVAAAHTHHRLNFETDCPFDSFISDESLLRNIVYNLLTNAIKFSPNASEISMSLRAAEGRLVIRVKDWGMGIPEKDRKNLFSSFTRGSNVQSIKGTGLGLSIAKRAAELLNGTITYESEVGLGTEFIVSLPLISMDQH